MIYPSYQQMRHLQDNEEPHQAVNSASHEPVHSGRHEFSLSDHIPSIENNNSSQQQQQTQTTTRKIKASSRITFNQILAQQNGSVPDASLASTDGSAGDPLVNRQIGAISGANNSPPPNNAAQLNQITITHHEAAIKFSGNKLDMSQMYCMYVLHLL